MMAHCGLILSAAPHIVSCMLNVPVVHQLARERERELVETARPPGLRARGEVELASGWVGRWSASVCTWPSTRAAGRLACTTSRVGKPGHSGRLPGPEPAAVAPTMQVAEHIEALEREGRLLAAAARAADLEVAVPSCPGWRLHDLLAHIGFVHRWAATYVAGGITEMAADPDEAVVLGAAPAGAEILEWVEEGHGALVRVLSDAPADLACWTFLHAPSPLAMWARRQAHETAIHRVDAELAARRPVAGFDPAFAVDGIEELLLGFLGRGRPREPEEPAPPSVGLVPTDRSERWAVRFLPGRVETVRDLTGTGAVIRATASDLYVSLWNRLAPATLQVTGSAELLDGWQERFRVTWS
jgi:uncharacterized protein (TIGR03083 family)